MSIFRESREAIEYIKEQDTIERMVREEKTLGLQIFESINEKFN